MENPEPHQHDKSPESSPVQQKENEEDDYEVEFLEMEYGPKSDFLPDFEDKLPDYDIPELADGADNSASESGSTPQENDSSQLNITGNLSSKEYKKYQYHFIGVFYVRSFKTQHLTDPVYTKDVYGKSMPDLFKCLWENSSNHVSREVIVEQVEGEKHVRWSAKEYPDYADLGKFVVLKHAKTKKLYSLDDVKDNSKILTNWRGKEIQVQIYKYSTSITSNTVWEMVKNLLRPEKKDRAGAPTTEEIFDCIHQLKDMHSHYSAHYSAWEKWANYILAQPGDHRVKLLSEAPPDEYLHLFRAPPISEGSQLQYTRHGLKVAYNINESVASSVSSLCKGIDALFLSVSEIQLQLHELKSQINTSRLLLNDMQASLPPEETEFSKKLASRVTDLPDFDHQE